MGGGRNIEGERKFSFARIGEKSVGLHQSLERGTWSLRKGTDDILTEQ